MGGRICGPLPVCATLTGASLSPAFSSIGIGHVLPGRSGDGVKLRGIGLDEDLFGRLEHVRGRLRGQALGRRCRGLPKSLRRGAAAGDARTGRDRGLPDGFRSSGAARNACAGRRTH